MRRGGGPARFLAVASRSQAFSFLCMSHSHGPWCPKGYLHLSDLVSLVVNLKQLCARLMQVLYAATDSDRLVVRRERTCNRVLGALRLCGYWDAVCARPSITRSFRCAASRKARCSLLSAQGRPSLRCALWPGPGGGPLASLPEYLAILAPGVASGRQEDLEARSVRL